MSYGFPREDPLCLIFTLQYIACFTIYSDWRTLRQIPFSLLVRQYKAFPQFLGERYSLSGRAQLGIIGFSSSVQSSQIRYATDSISNSRWDLNIRNNRINKQQLRARYIFIVIGVMTRKCLNWTFTATSLFLRDTYPNKWVECEFSLTDAIQCATLKLFNNDFRTIKRTLEP